MPLSQFSSVLRNVLCCLPGTYGVGIFRNHFMNGYLASMVDAGVPAENVSLIKDSFDGNLYVGGTQIPLWAMYVILMGACAVLLAAFVAVVMLKTRKGR